MYGLTGRSAASEMHHGNILFPLNRAGESEPVSNLTFHLLIQSVICARVRLLVCLSLLLCCCFIYSSGFPNPSPSPNSHSLIFLGCTFSPKWLTPLSLSFYASSFSHLLAWPYRLPSPLTHFLLQGSARTSNYTFAGSAAAGGGIVRVSSSVFSRMGNPLGSRSSDNLSSLATAGADAGAEGGGRAGATGVGAVSGDSSKSGSGRAHPSDTSSSVLSEKSIV